MEEEDWWGSLDFVYMYAVFGCMCEGSGYHFDIENSEGGS